METKKIRVLHIIGQISVGGCEKYLLELCRHMDRSMFEFAVCYYSPDPHNMREAFEEAGVRLYYVNKFGGVSLWGFFQALRGVIRDFQPDIIHTWQYSPNCWGRLAGLSCGYGRFICSEQSSKGFPTSLRFFEMIFGHGTLYAVNAKAVADAVRRATGHPPERIRIIHNGVKMAAIDKRQARDEVRAELGLPPDAPIVLAVGRLTPAKNYPMVLRVAKRVMQQRPDAVFLIAGHGELKEHLEQLHARLNLGSFLRMLGLRKDVPRLMAAADVFCLGSLWEGSPNVLVEAMASGLPAVCADFAGAREVLDDDGNRLGMLVDLDRDDQMAECVIRLLADPEQRARFGRAGRESVGRRFSLSRLMQETSRLYVDFMAGSLTARAGRRGCSRDREQG